MDQILHLTVLHYNDLALNVFPKCPYMLFSTHSTALINLLSGLASSSTYGATPLDRSTLLIGGTPKVHSRSTKYSLTTQAATNNKTAKMAIQGASVKPHESEVVFHTELFLKKARYPWNITFISKVERETDLARETMRVHKWRDMVAAARWLSVGSRRSCFVCALHGGSGDTCRI